MTPQERAALREAASKATPGPWRDGFGDGSGAGNVVTGPTNDTVIWNADILEDDARYIALAHPAAVLALLDECEKLREALREIDRLGTLVAHDLQGRVEAGKVMAVQRMADNARAALGDGA